MGNKKIGFDIIARQNLDRVLGTAGGALRGFSRLAGGVAKGIRATFRGLFDFRTILAGGGVLGGIGVSIKKAFDVETVQTQLKVLTGDARTAKKVFKELQDFSDVTPFEADEVATAGKNLIAFGSDAANVRKQLGMIGDVAAGVGIPLLELVEIYGKAQVAGRLYAEDINQLIGRGVPIMDALAKVTGNSKEELKKMVSEGEIGFPELQKAFAQLTGEGGKYNKMMEQMSATGNGLISTLKGKWNQALARFGDAFKDIAKDKIQFLIEKLDDLKRNKTIEEWAGKAVQAATSVGNVIGGLMDPEQRKEALAQVGGFFVAAFKDAGHAFLEVVLPGIINAVKQLPGFKEAAGVEDHFLRNKAEREVREEFASQGKTNPVFRTVKKEHRAEFEAEVENRFQRAKELSEYDVKRDILGSGGGNLAKFFEGFKQTKFAAPAPPPLAGDPDDDGGSGGGYSDDASSGSSKRRKGRIVFNRNKSQTRALSNKGRIGQLGALREGRLGRNRAEIAAHNARRSALGATLSAKTKEAAKQRELGSQANPTYVVVTNLETK